MKLTIKNFKAAIPKVQSKLLSPNYASIVTNAKTERGSIIPYKEPLQVESAPSPNMNPYVVMRYNRMDGTYGIYYHHTKCNVSKGPIFNDKTNKVYFASAGTLWASNYEALRGRRTLMATGDDKTHVASIPTAVAVSMQVVRDTPPTKPEDIKDPEYIAKLKLYNDYVARYADHRTYMYVWARVWNDGQIDMGGPSTDLLAYSGYASPEGPVYSYVYGDTPTSIAVRDGDYATLAIPSLPIQMFKDRMINRVFVYRSSVASSGETLFRLVDFFKVNPDNLADTGSESAKVVTTSAGSYWAFSDKMPSAGLGEAAISLSWSPWPTVDDSVMLSNGILVGYLDYEVFYSIPYQPHAWSPDNKVALDTKIVGAGSFEYTAVMLTQSNPVLITIQDASNPVVRPIKDVLPCISKGSISSSSKGVIFASDTGLYILNQDTPYNLVQNYYTKEQWLALNPASLIGGVFEDKYFGFFKSPTTVNGFVIDLSDMEAGITYLTDKIDDIFIDPEGTGVYILTGGFRTLYKYDMGVAYKNYNWHSKTFMSPEGLYTFAAARVDSSFDKGAITFRYYAGGKLRYTRNVSDREPFRLPSGFRTEQFEVEVEGKSELYDIQIASSLGELLYE